MTIGQKQLHLNGITWHCLSLFYARKNMVVLLNAINNFCETNKNLIQHWSMYFANEQGERVNLVFISKEQNSEKLADLIEQYFTRFLKENPSESLYSIPYGSILWIPYPNNSLGWNTFYIPHFLFENQKIRNFSQITSFLIANLYDENSSYEENVTAISTFLLIKLQKKQGISMNTIIDHESAETLQSYWEYEEDGLLVEWMQQAEITIAPFIIRSHLNY